MTDIVGILKGDVGWGCSANSEEELACVGGSCKCERQIKQAAVDEIERLRAALRRVRTAIFDAKPEVLTDTLWMHDRLGETVVDCIDDALNDYDWEVRDSAALGEKE